MRKFIFSLAIALGASATSLANRSEACTDIFGAESFAADYGGYGGGGFGYGGQQFAYGGNFGYGGGFARQRLRRQSLGLFEINRVSRLRQFERQRRFFAPRRRPPFGGGFGYGGQRFRRNRFAFDLGFEFGN